jgi:hypothetical protein
LCVPWVGREGRQHAHAVVDRVWRSAGRSTHALG